MRIIDERLKFRCDIKNTTLEDQLGFCRFKDDFNNPEFINDYMGRDWTKKNDARQLYFTLNPEDYCYVICVSHYLTGLEIAMMICNYTSHKLKYSSSSETAVLLVFKKEEKCNNWL